MGAELKPNAPITTKAQTYRHWVLDPRSTPCYTRPYTPRKRSHNHSVMIAREGATLNTTPPKMRLGQAGRRSVLEHKIPGD